MIEWILSLVVICMVCGGVIWLGIAQKDPLATLAGIAAALGGVSGVVLSAPLSIHPSNAAVTGAAIGLIVILLCIIVYEMVRHNKRE